jgi:hypothetical protein
MAAESSETSIKTEESINDILGTIDREREREIVARRFGLFDRKETLEQIGELLGITRERVRQLEKSVVNRLKASAEQGSVPRIADIQTEFLQYLHELGDIARVSSLTEKVGQDVSKLQQARIAFLAQLCPDLVVVNEDDHYHHAVGILATRDLTAIKDDVAKLIETIKKIGQPASIEEITKGAGLVSASSEKDTAKDKDAIQQAESLASIKWPMVNPKNIRDKIFVILKEHGKHMHFNEIASAIKDSEFKRKDVTTQAIHNELIKDKRFVLIGRGIYALKEWGYEKGTVSDIISEVLKQEGGPLHRDEIVKRVLKSRYVKETTILLNLQGKSQFKRVAKATYALTE